jgi:hypothetical protein
MIAIILYSYLSKRLIMSAYRRKLGGINAIELPIDIFTKTKRTVVVCVDVTSNSALDDARRIANRAITSGAIVECVVTFSTYAWVHVVSDNKCKFDDYIKTHTTNRAHRNSLSMAALMDALTINFAARNTHFVVCVDGTYTSDDVPKIQDASVKFMRSIKPTSSRIDVVLGKNLLEPSPQDVNLTGTATWVWNLTKYAMAHGLIYADSIDWKPEIEVPLIPANTHDVPIFFKNNDVWRAYLFQQANDTTTNIIIDGVTINITDDTDNIAINMANILYYAAMIRFQPEMINSNIRVIGDGNKEIASLGEKYNTAITYAADMIYAFRNGKLSIFADLVNLYKYLN